MAQSKLDPRYAFVVDYDDPQAGITRQYQLLYYLNDNTIEMYDLKNRRMFLKRCKYASISVEDLFLGATVVVHSRQLRVTEYGDDFTRNAFAEKSDSTLVIIQPEGYESLGQNIKKINHMGMRVMGMNMVQLTAEEATGFLQMVGMGEGGSYRGTVDRITQYPVVLMHLVGEPTPRIGDLPSVLAFPGKDNVDYFFGPNSTTKDRNNASLSNCSLCLIKPHAIHSGMGGDMICKLMSEGFEVSAITVAHVTAQDAAEFLEVYKGVVPEYNAMVDHLTSGPVWALEVRAENSVQNLRQLCGPYDPEIAKVLRPDSLRAQFGADKVRNAVHCTDLPEDGVLECEFFFRLLKQSTH